MPDDELCRALKGIGLAAKVVSVASTGLDGVIV